MMEALKTAMMTSISEVLETMFFLTIDATEVAEWPEVDGGITEETRFTSKINFSGPLLGSFFLTIPKSVLTDMTEMFMGYERENVTETHLSGTISEAINMIAGNTFSKLDDQAVFQLEIPELVEARTLLENAQSSEKETIFIRIETPSGYIGLQALYSI